jgi:predicted PolB exonuclease-like 3'-5' exonuclease
MKVFIDLETIPDQTEGAINKIAETLTVKCPFTTKGDIGKDLGMTAEDIKFIGANDLKQKWVDVKGSEAAKAQAEDKWLKTSFDGARGHIICIGYAFNNYEIKVLTTESMSEKEMLAEFWQDVSDTALSKPKQFIAHNANFDFPFLWHRSVINGVSPAFRFDPYQRQGDKRYCTMEAWAGFNGKIGLDALCDILGIEGKTEGMSGADVWPEYQKGNIQKIADYCADDVSALRAVYNRMNFL